MRYREIDLKRPKSIKITNTKTDIEFTIHMEYNNYLEYLLGETEKLRIYYPLSLSDIKKILQNELRRRHGE